MPKVYNKRTDEVPSEAVYVGRYTKWGNPFRIGIDGDRNAVIYKFIGYTNSLAPSDIAELRGKDLVCCCHTWDGEGKNPLYCHADILLRMANR